MQQGYQQPPPQQQQNYQQQPPQQQQGYQQPPPGQQPPPQQGYGPQPQPSPNKFPMVPVIIIVVVIVVVLLLVLLLMGGGGTKNMTPSEWNSEYNSANNFSSLSLDYPSLGDGDTVVITGSITGIDYTDDYYGIGYGDYSELELDGVSLNGLSWSGDLGDTHNVGDTVTITFHIKGESAYGISVEYIQELGLTGDHLPLSTITG